MVPRQIAQLKAASPEAAFLFYPAAPLSSAPKGSKSNSLFAESGTKAYFSNSYIRFLDELITRNRHGEF